jgi:hypothetical protein
MHESPLALTFLNAASGGPQVRILPRVVLSISSAMGSQIHFSSFKNF